MPPPGSRSPTTTTPRQGIRTEEEQLAGEARGEDPPGSATGGAELAPEVEEGCARALQVLRSSSAPDGLVASAEVPHYAAVWTRDVAFAALGAHVARDPKLAAAVAHSLVGLAQLQADSGQIPNTWWPERGSWDFHEAGCTDATCLFVIAASQHLEAHPDPRLERRLWPHLRRAMGWLEAQDANQFTLINSPSGGDWMDSTLQRSREAALRQRALPPGPAGDGGAHPWRARGQPGAGRSAPPQDRPAALAGTGKRPRRAARGDRPPPRRQGGIPASGRPRLPARGDARGPLPLHLPRGRGPLRGRV